MKHALISLSAILSLAACGEMTSPPASDHTVQDNAAVTSASPAPVADPIPGQLREPEPVEPEPGDLAPCPGINPDIRRPAGSNCLGITTDQCGADKVQYLVGRNGDDGLRRFIGGYAVGDYRWIPHMVAVTDDLRADRLNVELDPEGVIAAIDCY